MWKGGTPIPEEKAKFLTVAQLIKHLKDMDSTDEIRIIGPDISYCRATQVTKGCGGLVYLYCK